MKTITLKTTKSKAVQEWTRKEEGSFEDSGKHPAHVYLILCSFGGQLNLTYDRAVLLLESGKYHSTAWLPTEIVGGERTMKVIAGYCNQIQKLIS